MPITYEGAYDTRPIYLQPKDLIRSLFPAARSASWDWGMPDACQWADAWSGAGVLLGTQLKNPG